MVWNVEESGFWNLENICIFLPKRNVRNTKLQTLCRSVPSVTFCTNKPMFGKSNWESVQYFTFGSPTDGNLRYCFKRFIGRYIKIIYPFSKVKLSVQLSYAGYIHCHLISVRGQIFWEYYQRSSICNCFQSCGFRSF
jgi:hypothetical protein